jgi:hypothetical protein
MEMNKGMLHNKGCFQKVAKCFHDPGVAGRVLTALEEANEAIKPSTYKLRRLWKKLDFIPTGYEVGTSQGPAT